MAKQPQRELLTPVDRLAIRISNMINSPQAQLRRSALIHKLDADPEDAWLEVMGLLSETDGVTVAYQDDGGVMVFWEKPEAALIEQREDAWEMEEEAAPF